MHDWHIVSSSTTSLAILTFKFAPQDYNEAQHDAFNTRIRASLVSSNTAGIPTTKVRHMVILRISAPSPSVSVAEMVRIVAESDSVARFLVG